MALLRKVSDGRTEGKVYDLFGYAVEPYPIHLGGLARCQILGYTKCEVGWVVVVVRVVMIVGGYSIGRLL
jgi:hypothetical protein